MKRRDKPISSDDLFAEFRKDAAYVEAERNLKPRLALARNLLRLRAKRGMSQAQLAHAAGMRQPRIADLEGAKVNPRLDTLARVAAALGIGIDELLREYPDNAPNQGRVDPEPHYEAVIHTVVIRSESQRARLDEVRERWVSERPVWEEADMWGDWPRPSRIGKLLHASEVWESDFDA